MKTLLQIALVVIIVGLSYLVYDSIQQPIRFQQDQKTRATAVIERLKGIRDVQVAYRSIHNRYTGSIDTLVDFVRNGK